MYCGANGPVGLAVWAEDMMIVRVQTWSDGKVLILLLSKKQSVSCQSTGIEVVGVGRESQ